MSDEEIVETEVEAEVDAEIEVDEQGGDVDPDYQKAIDMGWDPDRDHTDPNFTNYKAFLRNRDAFSQNKDFREEVSSLQKGIEAINASFEEQKQQAVDAAIANLEAQRKKAFEDLDPQAASDAAVEIERLKSQQEAPAPKQQGGEPPAVIAARAANPIIDHSSPEFNPTANAAVEQIVNAEWSRLGGVELPPSEAVKIINKAVVQVRKDMNLDKPRRKPPKVNQTKKETTKVNYYNQLDDASKKTYDLIKNTGKDSEASLKAAEDFAKGIAGGAE